MSDQLPTEESYYPTEIHRLLKLGGNLIVPQKAEQTPHTPFDLPVSEPVSHEQHEQVVEPIRHEQQEQPKQVDSHIVIEDTQPVWVQFIRSNFILYPAIFLAAFLFFYSIFNLPSFLSQVSGWFAKAQDEKILGEDLTEYYQWMGGYYFSVGDRKSLEPTADIDRDGLSNLDEFEVRTNPTIADSDSDGISDGIEVINGSNFWGEGSMNDKQKKLVDGLDVIKISNRISFNVATNSLNPAVLGVTKVNYDLSKEGRLSVPKLGIQVPIVWTKDPNTFDVDLTRGVVHYPGTALPGDQGTVYISGHSSDYPWKRHPYKQIFASLNALEPGDDIFVDIYGLDGKLYNYRYRVTAENVYRPDDQAQFIDNSAAKLNLSTCWPIGTARDRYVVTAILDGV